MTTGPDEDRIEAFATYVNYAGTWEIDDDTVVHKIEHALDPNIQGLTLIRAVEREGGRMTFSGAPPGGTGTHVIVWKRR